MRSVGRNIQTAWMAMSVSSQMNSFIFINISYKNTFLVDNKICAGVSQDPQRYLVPHPTDCTKFYSCQRNGWGGWIANLMDCPVTTGFDRWQHFNEKYEEELFQKSCILAIWWSVTISTSYQDARWTCHALILGLTKMLMVWFPNRLSRNFS